MSRKYRLIIFVALMALLLAAVPFTLAQETFGLSADDYALFTSQDFQADAFSFDYTVNVNVTGAPDGDVTASFNGSGALGKDDSGSPVGTFTLTGNANMGADSTDANVEVRLVDGTLYYNLGNDSGWIGQDAADMLSSLSMMSPVPVNPSDLTSGDLSRDPAAMQAMGEAMTALSDPSTLQYISISRMDDMNDMAHFQVSLDLSGFLSSDAFTQLMTAAGSATGDDSNSMAGMGAMMAMMFQKMSLTLDEYISTADSRVGQATVDFVMSIDPSMAAAMSGNTDSTTPPSTTPIDVHFTLDITNMQYNQPISVSAPEGATMMPSMSGTTSGG